MLAVTAAPGPSRVVPIAGPRFAGPPPPAEGRPGARLGAMVGLDHGAAMTTSEAAFRTAVLPFTLHHEGGLSTDPRDPGNWTGGKPGRGTLVGTKYGIAASSHPMLDIRGLTLDGAAAIYWRDYVVRPGFAALPLPLLLVTFENSVNCGPGRARAFLAAAPGALPMADRIRAVCAASLAYHRRLKTWPIYGRGWAARIADGQRQALLLVTASPSPVAVHLPLPRSETRRAVPRAALQQPAGALAHLLCWFVDSFITPPPSRI